VKGERRKVEGETSLAAGKTCGDSYLKNSCAFNLSPLTFHLKKDTPKMLYQRILFISKFER